MSEIVCFTSFHKDRGGHWSVTVGFKPKNAKSTKIEGKSTSINLVCLSHRIRRVTVSSDRRNGRDHTVVFSLEVQWPPCDGAGFWIAGENAIDAPRVWRKVRLGTVVLHRGRRPLSEKETEKGSRDWERQRLREGGTGRLGFVYLFRWESEKGDVKKWVLGGFHFGPSNWIIVLSLFVRAGSGESGRFLPNPNSPETIRKNLISFTRWSVTR